MSYNKEIIKNYVIIILLAISFFMYFKYVNNSELNGINNQEYVLEDIDSLGLINNENIRKENKIKEQNILDSNLILSSKIKERSYEYEEFKISIKDEEIDSIYNSIVTIIDSSIASRDSIIQ